MRNLSHKLLYAIFVCVDITGLNSKEIKLQKAVIFCQSLFLLKETSHLWPDKNILSTEW